MKDEGRKEGRVAKLMFGNGKWIKNALQKIIQKSSLLVLSEKDTVRAGGTEGSENGNYFHLTYPSDCKIGRIMSPRVVGWQFDKVFSVEGFFPC